MDFVLDVEKREEVGKQAAKRLRRGGFVPGVVYGHGEETTPIKVPTMQISEFLKQSHGEAVSLKLKLGKKKYNAIIKAIERDPVTGDILHLDFQILHKGIQGFLLIRDLFLFALDFYPVPKLHLKDP